MPTTVVETPWGARYRRLFRLTSIARPLDAGYPTNRAVLILMPLIAIVAGSYAALYPANGVLTFALRAAVVAFAAWALARELAPDDNFCAFIALGLAVLSLGIWPAPSLGLLFAALLLGRIVNRSTGLPARIGDSLLVTGLVVWIAWVLETPLLIAVGALTFVFDAVLSEPKRTQFVFGLLAILAGVFLYLQHGIAPGNGDLDGIAIWIVAATVVGFLWRLVRTRRVVATGDVDGKPLNIDRVKAAMLVALLVAGQALAIGNDGLALAAPVWATLAGVASTSWRAGPGNAALAER